MARNVEILKTDLQSTYENYILRDVPDFEDDVYLVPIKIRIKENLKRLTSGISVSVNRFVGDDTEEMKADIINIYDILGYGGDSSESLTDDILALQKDSTSLHLDIDNIYEILNDSTSSDSSALLPRVVALENELEEFHNDATTQYGFYIRTGNTVETKYKNGTKRLKPDINTAIDDAYTDGGSVIVHPNETYYDEPILLKDNVDVELEDGVIVQKSSGAGCINNYYLNITSSVYGKGILRSSYGDVIRLENSGSNISIECKEIISTGFNAFAIFSIIPYFKIKCDYIYSDYLGIYHKLYNSTCLIDVFKIETGIDGTNTTGGTALVVKGNAHINIDEIICNNTGHTFRYDGGGTCYAKIRKQTLTRNHPSVSTTALSILRTQSADPCILNLEFDEILALNGTESVSAGAIFQRGEINLNGRKIYTDNDSAVSYQKSSSVYAGGLINVKEIKSNNWSAVDINTTGKVIIRDSNLIGNVDNWGALNVGYTYSSNLELINTQITNLNTGSHPYGIQIGVDSTKFVLDSVSIDVPTDLVGKSIKSDGTQTVYIKRPLWVNAPYDDTINLIGNIIGSY